MSRRRSYRKTAITGCALLCIAGLAVTIGWFRLAGSALPTRGSVRVPGILHPVDVQLDTFGVPYVTARAETDLVRALGYLHATDRMWQMEFFRRVAAGRLAELFGRDLVDTDRHAFNLGAGLELFQLRPVLPGSLSLDLHVQYSFLPERAMRKVLTVDAVGDYVAQGHIFAGGVTIEARFE